MVADIPDLGVLCSALCSRVEGARMQVVRVAVYGCACVCA